MKPSLFKLSNFYRRTLSALIRIVCEPGAEEASIVEKILADVELTLQSFPSVPRKLFLAGLKGFEYGSAARFSSPGIRFSRLPTPEAIAYYKSWTGSRFGGIRRLAMAFKSVLLLVYYDIPQVKERLDYHPQDWIERKARLWLERWGDKIRIFEKELLRPEPFTKVPTTYGKEILKNNQFSRPGHIFTCDTFHGGDLSCDVVVIGSGAGGAVVAAELAEGGLDVIVVEEGGYYTSEEFNAQVGDMVRKLYRDGGLQTTLGRPPIRFNEGKCVGGSTVINGGMSWRTPEEVLHRWSDQEGVEGIHPAMMERYFQRVEKIISAAYQEPSSIGRDNELFREGAERMGWKYVHNIRNQFHCLGCNNCILGCPTGAKRSTLVSYLPKAIAFGAHLYANCRVVKINMDGKRVTGVSGYVQSPISSGGNRIAFKITAKAVVVAAGAMQTPALLIRSGIKSASGRIGHDLSLHPNLAVSAVFDETVEGWKGVHQAYQVREFQRDGIIMAAVNLPPSILASNLPHYGKALGDIMQDYKRMVTAGVLVEDTGTGRVRTLPGGQPFATYNLNNLDAAKLVKGMGLLVELLLAAGARKILLPVDGAAAFLSSDEARHFLQRKISKEALQLSTVHIMGTARMGGDITRHVCNAYGAVYNIDRLYIADASLFPTPIGINPMETIMALATRNAERILETWNRN